MGRDDKLFGYYKRGLRGLKNVGKHRSKLQSGECGKQKKRKKINDDEYKNFWFLFNVVPCSTVISREEIRLIRIKDFLEVE